MDVQVEDAGKSESLLVMSKIGLVKTRDTQPERVQTVRLLTKEGISY